MPVDVQDGEEEEGVTVEKASKKSTREKGDRSRDPNGRLAKQQH